MVLARVLDETSSLAGQLSEISCRRDRRGRRFLRGMPLEHLQFANVWQPHVQGDDSGAETGGFPPTSGNLMAPDATVVDAHDGAADDASDDASDASDAGDADR